MITNACKMAINVGSSSVKTSIFYGARRVDVNINFIGLERQVVKVKHKGSPNNADRTYQVAIGDDLGKAASVVIDACVEALKALEWPSPVQIGHRVKFAGYGRRVERFTKKK